jgi:hypothetical protein
MRWTMAISVALLLEVNWLNEWFGGERLPAIDLAPVDLSRSEQCPEQHITSALQSDAGYVARIVGPAPIPSAQAVPDQ